MNKKELIRQNAIKLIAQTGYHDTTVSSIADEAKVAVGTIYNHFTDKREILNYIFEVEFNKRIKILQQLKEKDISLQEKLIAFLDHHFEHLSSNPETMSVLIQESRTPRKHNLEAIDNFMDRLPELLADIIDKSKATGEIRDVDSELIAHIIFHSIRGGVMKVADNEKHNLTQAKRELINLFWIGLEN